MFYLSADYLFISLQNIKIYEFQFQKSPKWHSNGFFCQTNNWKTHKALIYYNDKNNQQILTSEKLVPVKLLTFFLGKMTEMVDTWHENN